MAIFVHFIHFYHGHLERNSDAYLQSFLRHTFKLASYIIAKSDDYKNKGV